MPRLPVLCLYYAYVCPHPCQTFLRSMLLWVSGSLILLTALCVMLGPSFSPLLSYAELSISAPFAEFSPPRHPLIPCTQGHSLCEVCCAPHVAL